MSPHGSFFTGTLHDNEFCSRLNLSLRGGCGGRPVQASAAVAAEHQYPAGDCPNDQPLTNGEGNILVPVLTSEATATATLQKQSVVAAGGTLLGLLTLLLRSS